jgi:F-type H+-transporting ATPase subunit epsilon
MMADSVAFELVSPDRLLMSADVAQVVLSGREGDFTVLPGHAPVVTSLRPSVVEVIQTAGGDTTRIFLRGGFADVAADRLTVLAEEAVMIDELDRSSLEQRIQNATEDVDDASDDEARDAARELLDRLQVLLEALD